MSKRERDGGEKKKAIVAQPDDQRDFFHEVLSKEKDDKRQKFVRDLRVKVKTWQGEMRVDIRKHYKTYKSGGKVVPSEKGISLKVDEWNTLKGHVDAIDKAIADNL